MRCSQDSCGSLWVFNVSVPNQSPDMEKTITLKGTVSDGQCESESRVEIGS